ncbi:MAG TPA: DUF2569 domain-containing protein [Gammaproteobacteria bacterium]|jgi:hypothetical protein
MSEDQATQATATTGPMGLGGWLILPGIAMGLHLLWLLWDLMGLMAFRSGNVPDASAAGIDFSDPAFIRLLNYEFNTSIVMVIFLVALLVLFFTRSWLLPKAFIAFLALNILIRLFDVMQAHGVATLNTDNNADASFTALARPVIYAVVWGSYFLKSVRVRNTFIRPWPVAKPVSVVSS